MSGLQNWPLPTLSTKDWVLGEGASLFTGTAQKMEPQEVKREVGKGWGWEGWYWGEVCSSKDSLEGTAASHHQAHLLEEAWTSWFRSCKRLP